VELRDARLHRPAGRVDAVKLRYRSSPVPCRVEAGTAAPRDRLALALERPVEGVAPGQLACLLCDDLVVGAGTIVG
jgi:tRNA U34 2-thiouridine synthase MnmA/TrmU